MSAYSFVNKPILSGVPGLFLLPDEVKPYKAVLDEASGGNMGSPHYAILVDGVLRTTVSARRRPNAWSRCCARR